MKLLDTYEAAGIMYYLKFLIENVKIPQEGALEGGLFLSNINGKSLIFGMAVYLFSILEYINYYYVRLSYPLPELIKRIIKFDFSKSRIARLIISLPNKDPKLHKNYFNQNKSYSLTTI